MDNAVKALEMAGGVLIAILILKKINNNILITESPIPAYKPGVL